MATKKPVIDPQAASIRRAMALEGQVVDPTVKKTLDDTTSAYRAKYLAAFDIPQTVQTQAATVAPDTTKTRADLEKGYGGSVDPNSPDYVDPSNILQLVSSRMQGGKDYLSRVSNAVGNLWDKGVQSSRFATEDAQKAYDTKTARAQALLDEQNSLADYEKKAQIDARYRAPSGSGTDLSDLVSLQKNPLVSMQLAGYTRAPAPNGGKGWFFYNKDGKAVGVDEVAGRIGSSKADLLTGSDNPSDQKLISVSSGEQPTDTQAFRNDLSSGLITFKMPGADKKAIRNALLEAYPDKVTEITQALH